MTKPLSPADVGKDGGELFPGEVIAAFNECITKHYDGSSAEFTQEEVVKNILGRMPTATREDVYANRWLDIESTYRAKGWTVVYDKPGYCETYAATFKFRRRKGGRR